MGENKPMDSGSTALLSQLVEISRIAALNELASGIAHELNQPLGAIATFAQAGERMLNREIPLVSQTLDVLRQINDAAINAGEGIRRIRRLFDQESTIRSRCDIAELVEELRPVLELFAQRVSGDLSIDVASGLPAVNLDRLRIQHVLAALVQNACDAGAQGPSTPRIAVAASNDRYMVEITISDSGTGVSAGVQGQMFRPFVTTKAHGTGLGLASSKAIMDAHEGTIGFENLSTGGSRFWIRLPVASS